MLAATYKKGGPTVPQGVFGRPRSLPDDDDVVTGEVFTHTQVTPPPHVQSLRHREHMSMQARAAAMRQTDEELLVISAAESFTRVYDRLNSLSEARPELSAAYTRFLRGYEHRLHDDLWKPVRY